MPPRHLPDETVISLLRQGDNLGFRCWLPLEITRTFGRRFDLQRVGMLDVLSPPVEPLENTSNQIIKRVFDVAFSSAVLIMIFPALCLLVALIHRRFSPGPLFFKQSRVGMNGKPFQVYKFRSLHPNNPTESNQVCQGDCRVFKGGDFLRKTSIDEIPQFLNVFLGEMSVVGPRPHMEAARRRVSRYFRTLRSPKVCEARCDRTCAGERIPRGNQPSSRSAKPCEAGQLLRHPLARRPGSGDRGSDGLQSAQAIEERILSAQISRSLAIRLL